MSHTLRNLCLGVSMLVPILFLARVGYQRNLPTNQPIVQETEEVIELRRQVAAGQIRFQDGSVLVPPADARLNRPDVPAELHQALYQTAAGEYLRTQIQIWQNTRYVLGARSDEARLTGGEPMEWRLDPINPGDSGARQIINAEVPLTYAFLSEHLVPDMGAWSVYGTAAGPMRMSTNIRAKTAGNITLEIIGEVMEAPASMTVEERCARPCDAASPRGSRVTIPIPAAGTYAIALTVRPVKRSKGIIVPGLRLRVSDDAQISLAPAKPYRTMRPAAAAILVSADGVPLTNAQGHLTNVAHELNLLPVMGFGREDPRGLVAALDARTRDREDVVVGLTIDTHYQRQAQAVLDTQPLQNGQRAMLLALDADTGDILASAQAPRVESTRLNQWDLLAATKVGVEKTSPWGWQALDNAVPGSTFKLVIAMAVAEAASDDPLLMSFVRGCPITANGLVPCLGLSSSAYTYRMPGQSRPVGNFGRHTITDSLFIKQVPKPAWAPDCRPPATEGMAENHFGLSTAIRESVNTAFVRAQEIMDGPAAAAYLKKVRRIQDGAQPPTVPDFQVNKMIARLGLGRSQDLLYPLSGMLSDRTATMLQRTRVEPMQSDMSILVNHEKGWEWQNPADLLAQMAIGQRLRLTPLHLAILSATLASGHVAQPRIVTRWNGEALPIASRASLGLTTEGVAAIKAGMKAVPQVGTAKGAFAHWSKIYPGAVCHVAGKTGSGMLPRPGSKINKDGSPVEKDWTLTFTGYAEPEAFRLLAAPAAPARARRISFACMITGLQDEDATGGKLCAPLVAQFLERVARNHPDEVSTTD